MVAMQVLMTPAKLRANLYEGSQRNFTSVWRHEQAQVIVY